MIEKDLFAHTAFSAEIIGPDNKIVKLDLQSSATSTVDRSGIGKFREELPVTAVRDYTLRLSAQGATFKREKILPFKSVEPSAVLRIEQPPLPRLAPAPSPAPAQHAVSWTTVFINFLLVNVVADTLAAAAYFTRKLLLKRRERHAHH